MDAHCYGHHLPGVGAALSGGRCPLFHHRANLASFHMRKLPQACVWGFLVTSVQWVSCSTARPGTHRQCSATGGVTLRVNCVQLSLRTYPGRVCICACATVRAILTVPAALSREISGGRPSFRRTFGPGQVCLSSIMQTLIP